LDRYVVSKCRLSNTNLCRATSQKSEDASYTAPENWNRAGVLCVKKGLNFKLLSRWRWGFKGSLLLQDILFAATISTLAPGPISCNHWPSLFLSHWIQQLEHEVGSHLSSVPGSRISGYCFHVSSTPSFERSVVGVRT
jgi:hypothetical protein